MAFRTFLGTIGVVRPLPTGQRQGARGGRFTPKWDSAPRPYDASSTGLAAAVIPKWAQEGGTEALRKRAQDAGTRGHLLAEVAENIRRRGGPRSLVIAQYPRHRALEGKTLADIAYARRRPPDEVALELVGDSPSVVSFNMSDRDIEAIMRKPYTMTSSDGMLSPPGEGKPHPRGYGAFARKLVRYVRDKKTISLEDAIRSMTSLPATVFGLKDRGVLREGAHADVLVFALEAIRETATYQDPQRLAEGMSIVLVNGSPVVEEGRFSDALPGVVLRR